jgi:hypothetical protein
MTQELPTAVRLTPTIGLDVRGGRDRGRAAGFGRRLQTQGSSERLVNLGHSIRLKTTGSLTKA